MRSPLGCENGGGDWPGAPSASRRPTPPHPRACALPDCSRGEDGKPIYEDGTVGEAPKATSATADQNEDDDGAWEESFGGHRDSKPHGPTAVAMDVRFPGVQHVFGIPEHAAAFNLKSTDGSAGAFSEPYRLYNLDVFEYELDEPMALYGSIPFLVGHSHTHTAAAFWLNPSETFVDVSVRGLGPLAPGMPAPPPLTARPTPSAMGRAPHPTGSARAGWWTCSSSPAPRRAMSTRSTRH